MKSMTDYVIKCIACNGVSYETEREEHSDYTYLLYSCSENGCGCEWEIIDSAGKRSI